MKHIIIFILLSTFCFAQEKDSTITLSIPAIQKQIKILEESRTKEKKEYEDGKYQFELFSEIKKQNVIRIETMILDLIRIQSDTSLMIGRFDTTQVKRKLE